MIDRLDEATKAPPPSRHRQRLGLSRFDRMPDGVPLRASSGPMLHRFRIAGGGITPLGWPPEPAGNAEGWEWVHLDRQSSEAETYLRDTLALPEQVVEGLLDTETRPRLTRTREGLLLILRGINFNAGASPADMVALRLWITPERVVTLRRSPILAVHALREAYRGGEGPRTVGTFLVDLIEHLTDRMDEVVSDLMEEIDALEERVVEHEENDDTPRRLAEVRRRLVRLRRYLAPQRDALAALQRSAGKLMDDSDMLDLSESAEQCQRYVEEIESARERAIILQEELSTRADERVSRHSYMLSVAAGIFLPITFLTGLLGINVGGIPGGGDPNAFWVVVALCVGIAVGTLGVFFGRRWF